MFTHRKVANLLLSIKVAKCSFTTSTTNYTAPIAWLLATPRASTVFNFKKDYVWLVKEAIVHTNQQPNITKRHASELGAAPSFSKESATFLPFWIACNIKFQHKRCFYYPKNQQY